MLSDCGSTAELYHILSNDFDEFPISKSKSIGYFVDVLGRPIGNIEGDLLVWYSQNNKTLSIVFEKDGLACLIFTSYQAESYK